ncbi:hypothetical protein ACFL2F_01885 [Myxococcota bacterium]
MTRAPLFLIVFLLSMPSRAVDPIKLPAISADGKQVAFPEYFSDSMGMDSRVKFVKTCTDEGTTLHITCTECRQRDSEEIDKRLKDGGFKSLKPFKLPKKGQSSKLNRDGIIVKVKKMKRGYQITAVKGGKLIGKAEHKLEEGVEAVTAAILISKPTPCLYLELEIENGYSWTAVPL